MNGNHVTLSKRVRLYALAFVGVFALALTPAEAITLSRSAHSASRSALHKSPELLPGVRADHAVGPASLYAALARFTKKVPSFSRQTGLACSSCHYQFPQLTPFGRLFKLNGYTLTGIPTIGQPGDSAGRESLKLLSIPPLSAMVVGSLTHVNKTLPATQNGTAGFPQQLSVFLAGQIAPNVGTFTQVTYTSVDGTFGIDNVDIRYAGHHAIGDRDLLYGLTIHNNPTVQDVWNSVPAWGFPFMASSAAPSPIASTLIDGGLGQKVVGLGAYSLFDNLLYTELTAYRSALQGSAAPLDTTARTATSGVTPYWRVALQHEGKSTSLMLGTFGTVAHVYPVGVSGPTDHFTDVAVDAQVEQRSGVSTWIAHGIYIHERQELNATLLAAGATTASQTLSTARASVGYLPNLRYAFTLGYFQTSGSSDALLYAPGPGTGSANGSPNSSGVTGEFDFNAWQNTRFGLQYAAYRRFNGAATAYDLPLGRRATDNNTLYAFLWLAF